jgi:hypothetical protein
MLKKVDLVLHMLQWDPPPQPPVVAVEAPPSGRRLSRGMHVRSGGGASSPRVRSDNTGPRMGAWNAGIGNGAAWAWAGKQAQKHAYVQARTNTIDVGIHLDVRMLAYHYK